MKKMLLILTLTLIGMLVIGIGAASANTTYGPHGNYTADTDGCSACHETHAAQGSNLFKFSVTAGGNQTYKICTYCHGPAQLQSVYNVVDGKVVNAGTFRASGNGFAMAVDGSAITSKHNVDETGNLTADGGATAGGAFVDFSCSDCHNPHGSASDRLLVTKLDTVNSVGAAITRNVAKNFNIDITNPRANEAVSYVEGVNDFCGLCHYDYNTEGKGDTGDNTSGHYSAKYRHAMGINVEGAPSYAANALPVEKGLTGTAKNLVCLTCHFAHGTEKTAVKSYSNGQSALLRLNDRGVCIACHDW